MMEVCIPQVPKMAPLNITGGINSTSEYQGGVLLVAKLPEASRVTG
jgi:hypothetical protein